MTCKQTNRNAELLKKMREGLDLLLIQQCSVCDKIELGNEWYEGKWVEKNVLINNPYKIVHTPCSPECLSSGYGVDYMRAKELMKQ